MTDIHDVCPFVQTLSLAYSISDWQDVFPSCRVPSALWYGSSAVWTCAHSRPHPLKLLLCSSWFNQAVTAENQSDHQKVDTTFSPVGLLRKWTGAMET